MTPIELNGHTWQPHQGKVPPTQVPDQMLQECCSIQYVSQVWNHRYISQPAGSVGPAIVIWFLCRPPYKIPPCSHTLPTTISPSYNQQVQWQVLLPTARFSHPPQGIPPYCPNLVPNVLTGPNVLNTKQYWFDDWKWCVGRPRKL